MTGVATMSGPPAQRVRPNAAARTRTGWILPIRVGQVAVWQLGVLAVLATAFPLGSLGVTMIAVAVVAVAATSVRIGGLCAYQWAAIYVRYRLRRAAPPAQTPMLALLPDLFVHTHVDRAGNRVGIASIARTADYSVLVRVAPASHPDPARLMSVLHKAYERPDLPLSGAQLVIWAVPGLSKSATPIQVHWLALRYRMDEAPSAALARGGGEDGARRAASSAALRLASDLADAGYPSSVLDTPEVHQELLGALGADPDVLYGPVVGGHRITETWNSWSVGRLRQACFVLHDSADAAALLGRCAPEAAFTCTSYTLNRTTRGEVRATTAVRIGVSPSQFWLTPQRVSARFGLPLLPANGRQVAHVLGTLPLAH
jgi:type VII secretion protein EccE